MLKLTREIEEKIRQAGAEAYPNECCGILFGSEENGVNTVKALKSIDNALQRVKRKLEKSLDIKPGQLF